MNYIIERVEGYNPSFLAGSLADRVNIRIKEGYKPISNFVIIEIDQPEFRKKEGKKYLLIQPLLKED